jgi:hypothetical protein|tara:strand:- start:521 stop:736 length:216 start_codon:yes stop_codon:yes gene_type:complete
MSILLWRKNIDFFYNWIEHFERSEFHHLNISLPVIFNWQSGSLKMALARADELAEWKNDWIISIHYCFQPI